MKILIIDEGFIGSLHCALGLRAAGMDIVLLGAVGGRGSYHDDRFVAHLCPVPSHPQFQSCVRTIALRHACNVIMPVTEPTMLSLHAVRNTLPAPLFPQLNERTQRLLADKSEMSVMAASGGVSIPKQLVVSDARDVPRALEEIPPPIVVKPAFGRGGAGTRICADVHETQRAVMPHLAARRRCIVQQYVCGPTHLVGGLFDNGRPIRLYAGEKIEQQPARTGPAAVIVSVHNDALVTAALRAFASLGWTGLASADLVRPADGEFHFLEINPRPWGSIAAAADAGVDLFSPLARMLAGERPLADCSYDAKVVTRVLPLYLLNRSRWFDRRTAASLADDLASPQGALFRDVGLTAHVLHRLVRVRANWPSLAPKRRMRAALQL